MMRQRAAVLIPIKSFDLAKGRLSEAIKPASRAELARTMAGTVIAAARFLPVWVICDDAAVAAFATDNRAGVIWRPSQGLNVAAQEGVRFLADQGYERVVIAHADLPLASDLTWIPEDGGNGVTIVPDRRNDGSNVMCVPSNAGFQFASGPGSCSAHQAEATRLGLALRVVPDEQLGWDVDTPEDLVVFDSALFDSTASDPTTFDSPLKDKQ
jgi:2-phospho-L-lactate guanylyltransferase